MPSARQPRPKRVAEKVELQVWVVAAAVIVLAIDDFPAFITTPRCASQSGELGWQRRLTLQRGQPRRGHYDQRVYETLGTLIIIIMVPRTRVVAKIKPYAWAEVHAHARVVSSVTYVVVVTTVV